ENRSVPAFAWLASSGAPFDREGWAALAEEAQGLAGELARRLDEEAPPRPGCLLKAGAWNWSSPEQVKEAFAALGIARESTDDAALAGVSHPLAALLREHRSAARMATSYGRDWLRHVAADGRIYADWNQLGTVAGRTSCGGPNLQQVPRHPRFRRCFHAPEGRVLVKADYSQLQLRIAAKIADERRMLEAYAQGHDLHTLTAPALTGKEAVCKGQRPPATALDFCP